MAFNSAERLNMSAPIKQLSDTCTAFGYRGATVVRSAGWLMERGLSSFGSGTREVMDPQLIETANILALNGMPPYVVAAGLCHFMPEQGRYPAGFTRTIPVMKAFNYLMNLPQPTKADPSTPRNYQDFILGWDRFSSTMASEPRVLFNAHMLRAAHQLARLRLQTSGGMDLMENPVVEAQIAASTAHFLMKLGMEGLAQEMTDLSFSIIDPGSYAQMVSILDMSSSYSERLSFQKYLVSVLEHSLPQRVLTLYPDQPDMGISVSSRMKSVASAYNKIRRSREIADIIGARVVLNTPYEIDSINGLTEVLNSNLSEEEKDRAVTEYQSAIRALFDYKQAFVQIALELGWEERLDRYRDYVTNPRPNGYQALQCTYTTDKGLNFEVQFRTAGMHRCAELGGASHLHYKLGEGTDSSAIQTADPMTRFRRMLRQTREDSVTYGFLFDGLAPIDRSDITGPFRIELLPGRDRASVIDLLVAAGIERPFNCQNAQRFDQLSGTARTIHPYSPIENGDMVRPIMGAKPGLSSPKVELGIASQAALSALDAAKLSRDLGVSDLEAAKKRGLSIYDSAFEAVRKRRTGRVPGSLLSGSLTVSSLVPETILARRFGFDTFESMAAVIGAKGSAPEGFETAIEQLMITLITSRDSREVTFVYDRSSGITRCILSIIAGMNANLDRANISSDRKSTTFTASIGDNADAFFDRIEGELQRTSALPIAEGRGSSSYQKEIRIRISSKHDRTGMINDIFREFLKRDCLISSISSPEPIEGEFVVDISARFLKGVTERAINNFLSALSSKVPGVDAADLVP